MHDWVADLKNIAYTTSSPVTFPQTVPPTANRWDTHYGNTIDTPMVLMSLAFASTAVETTHAFLAEPTDSDTPLANQGLVVINTSGGPTITGAGRGNTDQGCNTADLPVGSFYFTLNNVPQSGTADLSFDVPAGAMDPTNPDGFLNSDNTIKLGLAWFQNKNCTWHPLSNVPIRLTPD